MACFNENVEHIKTSLHGRNTGDPRAIEAMQGAQAFQDAQTKRAREIDSRNLQDVAMTAYNGGNKAAVQAKLDIFSKTHGHRIEYDQVTGEDGVIKHVMKEVDPNTGQESVTEFTQDELGQVGEDPANLQKIIDNKAKFAQSERKLEQADYKLGQGDTKLEQGSRGLDIKEKALSLKKQISSESGVKPSDNLIEYALSLTNSGLTYTFPRSKQAIELQESFAKKWKEQGGESPSLARADYKAQSKALTSLVEQDARIEAFANTAKKNSDLILSMEGKILDMGSAFLNKPMRSLAMMTGVAPEIRAYNALITSIANEYTKLVTGDPKHALKKGDQDKMAKAINGDLSFKEVKEVLAILDREAKNRKQSVAEEIEGLKSRISGIGKKKYGSSEESSVPSGYNKSGSPSLAPGSPKSGSDLSPEFMRSLLTGK
jgi:hypothetical protein